MAKNDFLELSIAMSGNRKIGSRSDGKKSAGTRSRVHVTRRQWESLRRNMRKISVEQVTEIKGCENVVRIGCKTTRFTEHFTLPYLNINRITSSTNDTPGELNSVLASQMVLRTHCLPGKFRLKQVAPLLQNEDKRSRRSHHTYPTRIRKSHTIRDDDVVSPSTASSYDTSSGSSPQGDSLRIPLKTHFLTGPTTTLNDLNRTANTYHECAAHWKSETPSSGQDPLRSLARDADVGVVRVTHAVPEDQLEDPGEGEYQPERPHFFVSPAENQRVPPRALNQLSDLSREERVEKVSQKSQQHPSRLRQPAYASLDCCFANAANMPRSAVLV
ncbi:unnamed protein product [Heterotrigona itama]|uniref:Uncharacterized protein n=1 Tax=Heterotrigona itama TaxID=395501 RepID=A0A6V7HJ21_9HYME|nr:unnamed protein product [Heterotrigona itama]